MADEEKTELRMKDLVEATGAAKSTILFYVEKGLLPQPRKTSPNMAWYDPACIERIGFIRHLQQNHNMPLDKIKILLDSRDAGEDLAPLLELGQAVFWEEKGTPLGREEFCRETGMTSEQVDVLLKSRLLLPLEDGFFDQHDVTLGKIYAQGAANGMTVEDMEFYPRLGKEIVDREMRLRARITGDLPMKEDAAVTIEMVRGGPGGQELRDRPPVPAPGDRHAKSQG